MTKEKTTSTKVICTICAVLCFILAVVISFWGTYIWEDFINVSRQNLTTLWTVLYSLGSFIGGIVLLVIAFSDGTSY